MTTPLNKLKKLKAKNKNDQTKDLSQFTPLVTSDDRFKAMHYDPRFAAISKKDKKFKIDSRFSKVLSDPRFKVVATVDKYGRKTEVPAKNKEMEDFYYVENGEEEESNAQQEDQDEVDVIPQNKSKVKGQKNEKKKTNKKEDKPNKKGVGKKNGEQKVSCFTEDGKFEWNEESSSASDLEDIPLDIQNVEGEEDAAWDDEDENVPEGDPTKRLAMMNYDWENIKASDIMLFLTSFAPRNGYIKSVTVYPSEFGIERMEQEEKLGPQGIWKDDVPEEVKTEKKPYDDLEIDGTSAWIFREDQHVDIDPAKLRKYEKDRLKYYYAVIECDSVATAKHLYENCDGLEIELTSIKVDLRYIPNDMTFKREPKEVCTEPPATTSVGNFLNRAIQHTNVKLTWEEPKYDRFKELEKKIDTDDFDKLDLSKYIADTDSSVDSEDAEEEAAKKRELLLGNASAVDWKADFDKSKRKKNREQEIVIKFNPGFDELGNRILEKANPTKEKPKKKGARMKVKDDDDFFAEDEEPEEKVDMKKYKDELGLLVDNGDEKKKGSFKFDLDDKRFGALFNNSDKFAIDPTSKFYDSKTSGRVLEEQVKRRKKVKTS